MAPRLAIPALRDAPSRVAVVCDDGSFSYAVLDEQRAVLSDALRLGGVRQVVLHAEQTFSAYAALLALAAAGIPTILLPPDPSQAVSNLVTEMLGTDAVIRHGVIAPATGGVRRLLAPASVVLVTSGTTGTPKIVGHSWATLTRAVRVRPELDASIWLLAYPYHLYAGLQVVLHVLLNGGSAVMLSESREPEAILRRMADERVGFVSATPSFFRRLLLFGSRTARARTQLSQVTLGGERVTQDVLDALRATFPSSRLVHIYATSELGRCFAVDDGQEGFPAALLDSGTTDGVKLRVRSGELEVQPVNAMNGYLHVATQASDTSGWVSTGDLVDVVGDRVLFRGRRNDLINVGGLKVNPAMVEDVVRACPHVADARVFGHRSALVGELVAAEVVGDGTLDDGHLRATVVEHCASRLSSAERPRIVRVVPRIGVSEAGKVIRKAAAP